MDIWREESYGRTRAGTGNERGPRGSGIKCIGEGLVESVERGKIKSCTFYQVT